MTILKAVIAVLAITTIILIVGILVLSKVVYKQIWDEADELVDSYCDEYDVWNFTELPEYVQKQCMGEIQQLAINETINILVSLKNLIHIEIV